MSNDLPRWICPKLLTQEKHENRYNFYQYLRHSVIFSNTHLHLPITQALCVCRIYAFFRVHVCAVWVWEWGLKLLSWSQVMATCPPPYYSPPPYTISISPMPNTNPTQPSTSSECNQNRSTSSAIIPPIKSSCPPTTLPCLVSLLLLSITLLSLLVFFRSAFNQLEINIQ